MLKSPRRAGGICDRYVTRVANCLRPPSMARMVPNHFRQRQYYSKDLRERIIYLRYALKAKIIHISSLLNMSKHVVERTLQLWRTTGEVTKSGPGRSGKWARVMIGEEVQVRHTCIPVEYLI